MIELYHGDCLELMKDVPDKSIDMILCDLPYGTTRCSWDILIPFGPLWDSYNRIIKDHGAILLFSAQPFTTDLINSNRKMFRYEIIWEKTQKLGFLSANRMPLKAHENILVFYKSQPTYNPQKYTVNNPKHGIRVKKEDRAKHYGCVKQQDYQETNQRYPGDVIHFSNWNNARFGDTSKTVPHPTHKPIDLLEYLIKTYTNEGGTVLDNCMGSGSTGVACVNTKRNFIGMELNDDFFEYAKNRIDDARNPKWGPPASEKEGGQMSLEDFMCRPKEEKHDAERAGLYGAAGKRQREGDGQKD